MRMDAVTYPNPKVVEGLNSQFTCLKLNQQRCAKDIVEVLRPSKLLWTPSFAFFDHRGHEIKKNVGFFPPEEFLAELEHVLGMIDLLHRNYEDAFVRLDQIKQNTPQAHVAPEATFWAGVALFQREDKDKEALRKYWENLREQYPTSAWWARADVF